MAIKKTSTYKRYMFETLNLTIQFVEFMYNYTINNGVKERRYGCD